MALDKETIAVIYKALTLKCTRKRRMWRNLRIGKYSLITVIIYLDEEMASSILLMTTLRLCPLSKAFTAALCAFLCHLRRLYD